MLRKPARAHFADPEALVLGSDSISFGAFFGLRSCCVLSHYERCIRVLHAASFTVWDEACRLARWYL